MLLQRIWSGDILSPLFNKTKEVKKCSCSVCYSHIIFCICISTKVFFQTLLFLDQLLKPISRNFKQHYLYHLPINVLFTIRCKTHHGFIYHFQKTLHYLAILCCFQSLIPNPVCRELPFHPKIFEKSALNL